MPEHTRPARSRWARRFRDLTVAVLDRLVVWVPRSGSRQGIAVILPHALGDLLLFTPAFQHIRDHYPDQPLLLVCGTGAQAYAASYLRPDTLIVVDRARMRRDMRFRMQVLSKIGRARVQVALQPGRNREHLIEDALMRASGAAERIGSAGSFPLIADIERRRGDRWYTRLLPESADSRHETDHYAAFVAAIVGTAPIPALPRLSRPPRYPGVPSGDYVVVAFQSSSTLKSWPLERFIATANIVSAETGLTVVLAGQATRTPAGCGANVIDLSGETNLGDLVGVIAHAALVLCNESAPSLLAAALGVPVVVVAGGGLPGRYWPYPGRLQARLVMVQPPMACFGCGWRCRYTVPAGTAAPCVAEISVDRVAQAAISLLGQQVEP